MSNKESVESTQKEKEDKVTFTSFIRGIQSAFKNIFSVSTFFVAFKYIAFVGFTAISAILSVNMFSRLSTQSIERFALIGVAITLEFFKIFSIVRGNTLWRLKLKAQATRAYFMYTILAMVAIMASYGFTLTVVNRNIEVNSSSAIQLQIDNSKKAQEGYNASIASVEASIKANQARLAAIPVDFTSAAQTLNNTIAKLQATEATLQASLSAEQANEVNLRSQALEATKAATTTSSMFKLMADGFKWLIPSLTENSLMLFLLLLISVIIELGIISTSPAIPIDQKHLKHFLDEVSAHKAEELLQYAQTGKKKDRVRHDLSIAGRAAQTWMNWKTDVQEVLHPTPKTQALPAPKLPRLEPSQTTSIGSVPVRKPVVAKPVVPQKAEEAPLPPSSFRVEDEHKLPQNESAIPMPPVAAPKAEPVTEAPAKEAVPEDKGFSPSIPVRSTPSTTTGGSGTASVANEESSHASPVAPQLVAEAKIYRFGKTTEAVKDSFVSFISKMFNNDDPDAPLNEEAATASTGISPQLASTFVKRLLEIKGSRGVSLIEKRADGKLYPNYPEGYIISYATAEPARERTK